MTPAARRRTVGGLVGAWILIAPLAAALGHWGLGLFGPTSTGLLFHADWSQPLLLAIWAVLGTNRLTVRVPGALAGYVLYSLVHVGSLSVLFAPFSARLILTDSPGVLLGALPGFAVVMAGLVLMWLDGLSLAWFAEPPQGADRFGRSSRSGNCCSWSASLRSCLRAEIDRHSRHSILGGAAGRIGNCGRRNSAAHLLRTAGSAVAGAAGSPACAGLSAGNAARGAASARFLDAAAAHGAAGRRSARRHALADCGAIDPACVRLSGNDAGGLARGRGARNRDGRGGIRRLTVPRGNCRAEND